MSDSEVFSLRLFSFFKRHLLHLLFESLGCWPPGIGQASGSEFPSWIFTFPSLWAQASLWSAPDPRGSDLPLFGSVSSRWTWKPHSGWGWGVWVGRHFQVTVCGTHSCPIISSSLLSRSPALQPSFHLPETLVEIFLPLFSLLLSSLSLFSLLCCHLKEVWRVRGEKWML